MKNLFVKAPFYMILATIFFVVAHSSIKFLSVLPLHQIIFVRLFFSFLFCLIYFRVYKINLLQSMTQDLVLRGVFGALGMLCYFYTLTVLPLATAVTINYLSPMFAMLFAVLVVKERPSASVWFFLILAFVGVLLTKGFDHQVSWFDFFAAVLGAMFAGAAYVFVRKAGKTSDPLLVVFALPMVAMPFSIFSFFIYDFIMPSFNELGVLILMSIFVLLAQYTMTKAYTLGEVSKVSIFNYLTIIWSLAVGYYFFEEKISRTSLFGISIIIISLLCNEYLSFRLKKK